jgi:hypothetical protein
MGPPHPEKCELHVDVDWLGVILGSKHVAGLFYLPLRAYIIQ